MEKFSIFDPLQTMSFSPRKDTKTIQPITRVRFYDLPIIFQSRRATSNSVSTDRIARNKAKIEFLIADIVLTYVWRALLTIEHSRKYVLRDNYRQKMF